MNKQKVPLVAAIITAAALILAALIGVATKSGADTSPKIENGDNSPCVGNNVCTWNGKQSELLELDPPKGPGPWQFFTQDTFTDTGLDVGAVVRPCNVKLCDGKEGARLGVARGNSPAYAVCKQRTDFTAGLGDPPVWVKIKWPTNVVAIGGNDVYESRPDSSFEGWVHAHFLRPMGHDGKIPDC